jgi:hypothetical protein
MSSRYLYRPDIIPQSDLCESSVQGFQRYRNRGATAAGAEPSGYGPWDHHPGNKFNRTKKISLHPFFSGSGKSALFLVLSGVLVPGRQVRPARNEYISKARSFNRKSTGTDAYGPEAGERQY